NPKGYRVISPTRWTCWSLRALPFGLNLSDVSPSPYDAGPWQTITTLRREVRIDISDSLQTWPGGPSSVPLRRPGLHHPFSAVSCKALIVSRSEEHTSELQSPCNLVCRLLLEKK